MNTYSLFLEEIEKLKDIESQFQEKLNQLLQRQTVMEEKMTNIENHLAIIPTSFNSTFYPADPRQINLRSLGHSCNACNIYMSAGMVCTNSDCPCGFYEP